MIVGGGIGIIQEDWRSRGMISLEVEEKASTYWKSVWSGEDIVLFNNPAVGHNHDLSRFDNQSIERDRLIGIGFVLDFVEFISFTFSDNEMILVIEAVSR
ncbi:hypothetical protein Tco_0634674 [Tanacetum coccineum]